MVNGFSTSIGVTHHVFIFARFLVATTFSLHVYLLLKENERTSTGLDWPVHIRPVIGSLFYWCLDKSYQAFSAKKKTPSKRLNDIAPLQKKINKI